MGEAMKVWLDGHVVDGRDALIPVTDHGFLYGDGIFEGMRIYGRRVFRLDDHLARLGTCARSIGLTIPGGLPRIREIVLATARAFGADEAYIRLVISRGEGSLGVDPTSCRKARIVCMIDHILLYPEEKLSAGISLVTSSLRRPMADALDPRVKSLNYLNNALAKLEARQRGADEALILNHNGTVAEASVANVFALKGDVLRTPPTSDGALEGITRDTVMQLAQRKRIAVEEHSLGRFDLMAADEVFLTGSGARVVPVGTLDNQAIGGGGAGPVTLQLVEAFLEYAPGAGVPFDR